MFKYLLKTDHSQSSSLARILKNINAYLKEVLTLGKTDTWKQKREGWTIMLDEEEEENLPWFWQNFWGGLVLGVMALAMSILRPGRAEVAMGLPNVPAAVSTTA